MIANEQDIVDCLRFANLIEPVEGRIRIPLPPDKHHSAGSTLVCLQFGDAAIARKFCIEMGQRHG